MLVSPYQYQGPMASHDTNTNNNANPVAHSLNIIPTKFGTLTVNRFSEREKFYPVPGLEPGLLAFRANALTNQAIQDKYQAMIKLISSISLDLNTKFST